MDFKETIDLINAHGVTAYEIHKETGLNEAGVRRVLNGEVDNPQRKTREAILSFAERFKKPIQPDIKNITGFYYPDVRASAGLETAFENEELVRIPVSIPSFGSDIDFINVYGDSMYPKFCSGEIIGIKEVEPQYLNYGYAYVVVLQDGQVFLKYIQKGKDEQHWVLESENKKYEPKEFHLNLIKKVFIIKGVITKTTM